MLSLVTGADGMLGSWVAKRLLADGHSVVSIEHDTKPFSTASLIGVKSKIIWAKGSINDAMFVKRVIADYAPEIVFHLAALPLVQTSTRTSAPIFQTNVMGTVNILDSLKDCKAAGKNIRLVFVSSDKAYGVAGNVAYTEDMPLNGLSLYDASKSAADIIVRSYAACGYVDAAVARPANIIAPGDLNLGRVLNRAIIPALCGDNPTMYKTTFSREYIWVEDAVDALVTMGNRMWQSNIGSAFNVGTGDQRTLEQVINEVLKYFPDIQPKWTRLPETNQVEIPFQSLDTSKIERVFGWKAKTSFEDAVGKLIAWWKTEWPNIPDSIKKARVTGWH